MRSKLVFLEQIAVLLLALFMALLVGALLLLLAGADPVRAYTSMLLGPLSTRYGFSESLVRATPLLLVGLGIVISFRTGIRNIGGEGQMVVGALAGTFVAVSLPLVPGVLLLPMVVLAGALAGALWGALAGFLRARLQVNEILSTIMLNLIALQVGSFLIRGPMRDPVESAYGTGYPQTAMVPTQVWLPRLLPGTRLHWGFILAIVLAVCVYIFLWRTTIGFRMRMVGAGTEAARYAGVSVSLYLVMAMALAGGLAGTAGVVEVLGLHRRTLDGISAGYGFSGIVIALFGRLHPLGAIPAAILFGMLILGADMMQRAVSVPAAIVLTIQGLVILFVTSSDTLSRRRSIWSSFRRRVLRQRGAPQQGGLSIKEL